MQSFKKNRYTYEEYYAWDDDTRCELIDGEVYMMSPAPTSIHQRISVSLTTRFATYLRGKTCEVFAAPFDVRLNADAEDNTVVQPDICIICDPKKIDARGCKGAPDMVVEILSPGTAAYDKTLKYSVYLKAGVREYWIVDPDARTVTVHVRKGNRYVSRKAGDGDVVAVGVLDDCAIHMADVFPAAVPGDA